MSRISGKSVLAEIDRQLKKLHYDVVAGVTVIILGILTMIFFFIGTRGDFTNLDFNGFFLLMIGLGMIGIGVLVTHTSNAKQMELLLEKARVS